MLLICHFTVLAHDQTVMRCCSLSLSFKAQSLSSVNRWEERECTLENECKKQEDAWQGEFLGQRSTFKGVKWPFCAVSLVDVEYGSWPSTEN